MREKSTAEGRRVGRRVLVLEDNSGDFELLRIAVQQRTPDHFELVRVDTVAEALETFDPHAFDLIIVDLYVPDSSGRETFERIRDAHPDVPIVVATGRSDSHLGLQLVREGAQDFLVKSQISSELVGRCLEYAIVRQEIENSVRKAQEEAAAASQAKTVFLASMSHEIRTPLTAILGMSDLLLDTKLTGQQESYVRTLKRCGQVLLGLLNNVLELSRVESGEIEIHPTRFELRELVCDVVDMFGFSAEQKGVALCLEMVPGLPEYVVADPNRMREILVNLVGNALKFTDAGEVRIRVLPGSAAGQLRFDIIDTGRGMSPEERRRVFERFVQGNDEIKGRYGGSGLGLAISKELIERMDGHIGVESQPGEGSTFSFEIPVRYDTPAAPAPGTDELAGTRILVAESSDADRRTLLDWLDSWSAEVLPAANAEEAYAVLERSLATREMPDVALVDSRMPGAGGMALAARLCERPRLVQRVVVLLPMAHRASDLERARKLGVDLVFKPLRSRTLLEVLRRGAGTTGPGRAEPRTRLGPLRLLVVDDSPDNRALLLAFLEKAGCAVELADDGAQGVDRFVADRFDLVLMDMKMPVMDGYEATRAIRRWELENQREPTPIVALTAFAFREEGERCLEAGCNEHLAKPIERGRLLDTLRRLAGGARIRVEASPDIADLVPEYLEGRRRDVQAVATAAEHGDFETIRSLGHNMRGTGRAYGFESLSELGHELELAGKNEDRERARRLGRDLGDYLERVEVVMPPDTGPRLEEGERS